MRTLKSELLLLYPSIYHFITCVTLWRNLPQNFFYYTLYILFSYLRHFMTQMSLKTTFTVPFYMPFRYLLASLCETFSLKKSFTLLLYMPSNYLHHFVRQSPSKLLFLYPSIYYSWVSIISTVLLSIQAGNFYKDLH